MQIDLLVQEFYANFYILRVHGLTKNKSKFNSTKTLIAASNAISSLIKVINAIPPEILYEYISPYDIYNTLFLAKNIYRLVPNSCEWTRKTYAKEYLEHKLKELESMEIIVQNGKSK